jgi:hypothetical protein
MTIEIKCQCGKDHDSMERKPTRSVVQCKVCKNYFHPAKYTPMCMPDQWTCYGCSIKHE